MHVELKRYEDPPDRKKRLTTLIIHILDFADTHGNGPNHTEYRSEHENRSSDQLAFSLRISMSSSPEVIRIDFGDLCCQSSWSSKFGRSLPQRYSQGVGLMNARPYLAVEYMLNQHKREVCQIDGQWCAEKKKVD
jgi:hypothetical protein